MLLLDELGALPPASREALGNALRSFFHDRLVLPPLSKKRSKRSKRRNEEQIGLAVQLMPLSRP